MTGVMSIPVPSPSIYGMIGWFGTLRLKSLLTEIFSPFDGTLMCWYMASPRDVWGCSVQGLVEASAPLQGQAQRAPQCNPLHAPSSLCEVNPPLVRIVSGSDARLSAPHDLEGSG